MKILKKEKERNLRSEPERDVREGRWNLLEFEEANDGFTTPNPWKRVAIGSPKKDGNERFIYGREMDGEIKEDVLCVCAVTFT